MIQSDFQADYGEVAGLTSMLRPGFCIISSGSNGVSLRSNMLPAESG